MKPAIAKFTVFAAAALLVASHYVEAGRAGGQHGGNRGGGGGGGGHRGGNIQRPAQKHGGGGQRPSPKRPENIKRPGNSGGSGRLPAGGRPGGSGQRPSLPEHRPASGSIQRPQMPQQISRPQTADKAAFPAQARPANLGKDMPNKPIDFGGQAQARPKLPGNDKMAGAADRLPPNFTKPSTRPAAPGMDLSKLPNSPAGNRLPGATRPGQTQPGGKFADRRPGGVPPRTALEKYPGLADSIDKRPGGYDKWQQNRGEHWDSWQSKHADQLDEFQTNRDDRWNNISALQEDRQDFYTNRREDWQNWTNDVQDYRRDRAWEILDDVRDYNANLFVPGWYYRNSWWGGPLYGANINPWVWWRPAAWTGLASFLGSAIGSQIDNDYGTQVYYDETNYYIEGQPVATAPQYREQALDLAAVESSEEPFLPAESGADEGWYPLGVWALTQEEKGDAVMFYQLAVNKNGEVSGAYSNVLTGESSPVTGSVDFETQRVAWRTGDSESTALEANLAGLTKEFTPVFVHYGTGQTQEWLLVRLEDPS